VRRIREHRRRAPKDLFDLVGRQSVRQALVTVAGIPLEAADGDRR